MFESYWFACRQLGRKSQCGWNGLGVRARIGLRLSQRAKGRSRHENGNTNEQKARNEPAHTGRFFQTRGQAFERPLASESLASAGIFPDGLLTVACDRDYVASDFVEIRHFVFTAPSRALGKLQIDGKPNESTTVAFASRELPQGNF